jgi:hypothetical protein
VSQICWKDFKMKIFNSHCQLLYIQLPHWVMTCALYIKWQHYIIRLKPSYYYEHYLLWLLASLPRCLGAWSVYQLLLWTLLTVTTGFPSSMSSAWSGYQLLLSTLFTVTTGFPSSMSSAWSVYQCLLSLPSCWPSRNIHSVPFIISGHQFLSNFTISNPIRNWNCNLETVKNESKLTSVILISLLADRVIAAEA